MAKKWQRMAALARRRLAPPSMPDEETKGSCCTSASKGHCVVYSADGRRFEVPLAYLGTTIFEELLRMSQEEFGFTGGDGGRITLPCDSEVVEYVVCLLRRGASEEVERALVRRQLLGEALQLWEWLGTIHGICPNKLLSLVL